MKHFWSMYEGIKRNSKPVVMYSLEGKLEKMSLAC